MLTDRDLAIATANLLSGLVSKLVNSGALSTDDALELIQSTATKSAGNPEEKGVKEALHLMFPNAPLA